MLGERLRAARHARFVGRLAEKQVFEEALRAAQPPWHVLHLFGPGGVGKTTLLQEFALLCEREAIPCAYLDVRSTEPAPQAFVEALTRAVGASNQDGLLVQLATHPRYVILIDTYEALAPLDDWLREIFLPTLPESTLVVLAGRDAPTAAWRADPGWQSLMQVISLRNLDSSDSLDYLARRQVPGEQHKAVLSFTYGHPLALSLVADVFAQRRDIQFQPDEMPDVVRTLLDKFIQKLPGPQHRSALEASALVRLMTESLLAAMLDIDDAHELFVWLSSLSFMETGTEGVFPHDLAREALATDLRWRNPERYTELHQRARKHYFERFLQTAGPVQQRVLLDYIFLHRDNPLVKPYFEWQSGANVIADALQPTDIAILTAIVQKHEGQDSARIASYWFSRQPDTVIVMRDNKRQPVGFVMMLALHRATPDDIAFDPAVRAARNYLQNNTALRPGESATLFRFWMERDTYQEVSPVQTQIFLSMVRHYLSTPGLAFTFLPSADPDFWMLAFSYADLARLPQADFTVDGRRYGVYGHDWRIVPPIAWLELMGEREVSSQANATPPPPVEQVIVLSESEFAEAVQAALRDYARPDMLHSNPLLRSKLVMEASGLNADENARAAALRDLLRATAESMQQSPREAKFYRSLYHTYFQPAPTQEQAAEILDLPFSSYRRHLKSGITRVTEILWNQEIK
ncbi:MAG: ATP-binding protein [Anaerolineae bacterium]|nr:ATP-binding protein [Anaerolineae bacterium]